MKQLNENICIKRNSDIVAAEMDGDIVMMSIDRGQYYGISGVGKRCWELLIDATTVNALVKCICEEFNIDEVTCSVDIQEFIDELIKNDLVSEVR